MDSGSQAAVDGGGGRSGGKILKRRPIAARKTPYDRPTPPPQPENSNWRNGLLFPAKFVAGGATKLLSSIWNPKSWASHSSSSDSDSDSEVGIEDELVCDENLPDGEPELNQQNKGSSSGKDYTMSAGVDDAPKKPDISNKAIMEARKIISENMAGTSSKSDLDNNIHGSKSFMTPDRDYLSGGSLVAPKPGNGSANLASNDMKNTQDDVPAEAVLSLPTIEEQNLIAEEKDDKTGDDVNLVEGNHDLITDHTEVVDLINVSQGSSNTSDPPSSTKAANSPSANHRPVTRSRKYNTRRGRARGK